MKQRKKTTSDLELPQNKVDAAENKFQPFWCPLNIGHYSASSFNVLFNKKQGKIFVFHWVRNEKGKSLKD